MTLTNGPLIELLNEGCQKGVFSGAQLAFAFEGLPPRIACVGTTQTYQGKPISEDTLFDIGSITKTFFTTSVLARLVDKKQIHLEGPLSQVLPETQTRALAKLGQLSLSDILAHASGLAGWLPLYEEPSPSVLDYFRMAPHRVLIHAPRSQALYSDLGFYLLGYALEKSFGPLKELLEKEVTGPLSLTHTGFGPLKPNQSVATTEYCLWRKRWLQGEVFDENTFAHHAQSGAAGLFSTAGDTLVWAEEWRKARQGNSPWLSAETANLFTTRSGKTSQSTWALGWDTPAPQHSSAGKFFSKTSFGGLGFPGCSVWVDPERDGVVVFHSNRTHPSRFNKQIASFRPLLHDLIIEQWKSQKH